MPCAASAVRSPKHCCIAIGCCTTASLPADSLIETPMQDIEVPILIVGGGGCGLATSLFLSKQGIRSLLIERHPAPGRLPKARYVSQRTMELLRQFDLAERVYE